jgi:hypothetical protein
MTFPSSVMPPYFYKRAGSTKANIIADFFMATESFTISNRLSIQANFNLDTFTVMEDCAIAKNSAL